MAMKNIYRAARERRYEDLMGLRPWRRHSVVLAVAGGVYIVYGFVLMDISPTDSRVRGMKLAISWMSLADWGIVWILIGVLAIASTRWPPASETWGYSAMSGISALWALFYTLGIIFLGTPPSGLAGAVVWGLVAFLWWGISGLRNPEDHAPELLPRGFDAGDPHSLPYVVPQESRDEGT